MLGSFGFAVEHGAFHRDQGTSLISLLLEEGGDPLDCSSCRPISLVPCDLKIYAKIFASRLEKVVRGLIGGDQAGFIGGRNASGNVRRLLHVLDFADSRPAPCAVFSLDAGGAFDGLEWSCVWAVLRCFGFGEHFVSVVGTLYHSPAASVIAGGVVPPHSLCSGERDRDVPLSPYCFVCLLSPWRRPSGGLGCRLRFMTIIMVFHYALMILFCIWTTLMFQSLV